MDMPDKDKMSLYKCNYTDTLISFPYSLDSEIFLKNYLKSILKQYKTI